MPPPQTKKASTTNEYNVTFTSDIDTTEYFPDVKGVKFTQGLHVLASNVWKGSNPPEQWPPKEENQRPSHTTYYARAENLHFDGGEFIASKNYVDTRSASSVPAPGQQGSWGPYPTGFSTQQAGPPYRNNTGHGYASYDGYGPPNPSYPRQQNRGPIYTPTLQEEPQSWNGPMMNNRPGQEYNAPQQGNGMEGYYNSPQLPRHYREDSIQPSPFQAQMPQPIGYPVAEIGNQGQHVPQIPADAAFGSVNQQPRVSGSGTSRGERSSMSRRHDVNEGMATLHINDEEVKIDEEVAPALLKNDKKPKPKWTSKFGLKR